jgi:DNA-binding SARP family transcriptional activator/tetratricopeptide (TPR) repeat protein
VWDLRLLGPLEVLRDGVPVPLSAAMLRNLLACLPFRANQPVSVDTIAEALWPEDPPADVRGTLRSYVMRLRRALGQDRIETGPAGYVVRVEAGELDLARFRSIAERARAEPEPAGSARLWHEALDLWRGEPMANVPCAALRDEHLPWLTELRLSAVESRVDADLRLGVSGEIIPELRGLVAEHPFRERFWVQLMKALHGSARQADALDAYRALSTVLREELGIEPSREVRELHRRLLEGGSPAPRPDVPAQLPAAARGFTGRADDRRALDALLDLGGNEAVIGAITGTAGAGKTTLAVRWGHDRRSAFPDGQLYLDLCGYGPRTPLDPADALASLLRSLGAAVPPHLAERAAVFRSRVDGRRLLLVLDNAENAEQVRPLLPGSASCLVLVTSRDDLAGLVARDGARRVDIGLLSATESRALLTTLIGDRAEADPDAVDRLAARCAHLPLALRIAAESAIAQPGSPLSELTELIGHRPLAAGDDDPSSVHTVFSWSMGRLRPEVARTFRFLGCQRGRTFDANVIAALTERDQRTAHALAWSLVRAHLVEHVGDGRFRMHDLLHDYAVTLAEEAACEANADEAFQRLLDYYTHAASRAARVLAPYEAAYLPQATADAVPAPEFAEAGAARRWLDAERQNIIQLCENASARGAHDAVVAIARALYRYLDTGGFRDDSVRLSSLALKAPRNHPGYPYVLVGTSFSISRGGSRDTAARHARQAIDLAREAGDGHAESWALLALSVNTPNLAEGAEHEAASLRIATASGDALGQCRALVNLAATTGWMGDTASSERYALRGLRIAEEHDIQTFVARVLNDLGHTHIHTGRLDSAEGYLRRGVDAGIASGDRSALGYLLSNIGFVHLRRGRFAEAALELRQALAIAEDMSDHSLRSGTHNKLGELARRTGRGHDAVIEYSHALDLARRTGMSNDLIDAHCGYAHALLDVGEHERARAAWADAQRLAVEHRTAPDPDLAARLA